MSAFDTIIDEIANTSPASKSSPKGAQRAKRDATTIPMSRAAKVPAKAGRKASQSAMPTLSQPSATIPASAGADEANHWPQPILAVPRQQSSRRKAGEIGHTCDVNHCPGADLETSANNGGDAGQHRPEPQHRLASVGHTQSAPASANSTPERGDAAGQRKRVPLLDAAGGVENIVYLWRMRQRWHRAEKSLILQGKALCRSWTEGDKEKAGDLFDAVSGGKEAPTEVVVALMPFLASIERFRPERAKIEKQLQRLAKALPVWPWVVEQKGFGPLNLAAIVGEAGDIGSYRNPSCLWKRMGLAVIGQERQRKKADAEGALAHGYNPARRAVAYLLGDCLVKGNGEGKYRALYLERKEIEAAREDVKTKAHAHNRAARYMTKRVLRDLWSAWKRT